MKTSFWDWVIKTFYVIPGHPELDAKHSLVMTLDSQVRYLPTQDENSIPIQVQAIWLAIYILLWITLAFFIIRDKVSIKNKDWNSNWNVYILGFVSGLIMILLESFLFTKISSVKILKDPLHPVIFNNPDITDIEKGTDVSDPDKYINYSMGQGDYKILKNNKTIPNDGISGYIFTADTYLNKVSKGEITGMNLEDYLTEELLIEADHPDSFQTSNQEDVKYFADKVQTISLVAYYISIIVITWAIYITSSKWGTRHKLQWILLSFMLSILASAIVVDSSDIVSFNNILFLKRRLIIYAVSVGITSIFIV
jgi:hypothetical protein|tara:strand:+ start:9162 stop:10091 length:930 start_codon:yes stop_codon:yes gene_type:complete